MTNFTVSKQLLLDNFITPLSQFDIEDNSAMLELKDTNLMGLTHSQDRSLILQTTLKNVVNPVKFDPVVLKGLKKLRPALKYIDNINPSFKIMDNYLEYSDDLVKFKSYFLDIRFFQTKQSDKIKKISELEFDFSFGLTQKALTNIRKSSQFTDTSKLYIDASPKTGVMITRKDDEAKNVNSIGFKVSDEYTGIPLTNIPLHISTFNWICESNESILLSYCSKVGVITLTVDTPDYNLYYITSRLKK